MDSGSSSPRTQKKQDDSGMKAVLKELRSEYHQINEMEARIQSQRVKWMQSVEHWLDRQEQLAIQQTPARLSRLCNGKRASSTPRSQDNDLDMQDPGAASAAGDPHALTTHHGEQRPGPRPCPPPQLPELDDGAIFEPELPKASDYEITNAWDQSSMFYDEDGQHKEAMSGDGRRNGNSGGSDHNNDSMRNSGRHIEVLHTVSAINEGRRVSKQAEAVATPAAKRFNSSRRDKRSTVNGSGSGHSICFWLDAMINHPAFDSTCAFMIIFNSAIIGWTVQALTQEDEEPNFTVMASHACTGFFIAELLLRMSLYGRKFFTNENRGWNIFDFLLVVISIVDLIMGAIVQGETSSLAQNLKTIKMLRIIRVFRVFRFFRELSLLALMIVDSLYSLTWALILLMIIIYVFSICFTSMATDYIKGPDAELTMSSEVQRLFGSLTITIYTLVLSMLNGVSWGVASDALAEINAFACGLFLFYAAFTILAVMNIITGVFVDNAVETARTQRDFLIQKEMELKEKYASEMRGLFSEMDKDGSGTISYHEVQQYLQDPRVQGYFAALGLDPNDTERLFRLIDDDGSGDVDVGEFLDGCIRLKGQARSIDVYALMRHLKDLENKFDLFTDTLREEVLLHGALEEMTVHGHL